MGNGHPRLTNFFTQKLEGSVLKKREKPHCLKSSFILGYFLIFIRENKPIEKLPDVSKRLKVQHTFNGKHMSPPDCHKLIMDKMSLHYTYPTNIRSSRWSTPSSAKNGYKSSETYLNNKLNKQLNKWLINCKYEYITFTPYWTQFNLIECTDECNST